MLFTEDATYYAKLIKEKQVKILSLVEAALANIERLNPALNAVITVQATEARELAKQHHANLVNMAESDIQSLPFFYGVPILLKDLGQNQEGISSTSGARLLANNIASQTDNFVQAIIDAGFIIVGRTNVPEYGFKNISDSEFFGSVNAVFDSERNPGGSSGGAASALKASMVPIVTASDGGGSIRIPASFNGLIGLKPSRGRIPVGPGSYRGWQGASIHFALTKSVRDTWQLLKQLQVEQYDAPFIIPKMEQVELTPLNRPLKIAYAKESPIHEPLQGEAEKLLEHTLSQLEKLGHQVEEAAPKIDGVKAMETYYIVNAVETAVMMDEIESGLGCSLELNDMELMTWALYRAGLKIDGVTYSKVLSYWDEMTAVSEAFFNHYDVLLMPATNGPAPLHSAFPKSRQLIAQLKEIDKYSSEKQLALIWEMFAESLAWTPFTQQMNLTGQPAISLPTYLTKEGLPLGVQFSANKGQEYLLLQLAQQFEKHGLLQLSH